jgi:pyruvate formate lyase activating enzyme
MVFGGIQKNSFIDYPGKISCVLFVSGCNFDCPYCHNPGLVKFAPMASPSLSGEAVFEFLERRKRFLDGVVISGGEPTLQKDIVCLCEKIKEMGYPVKLDTNGSRPQTVKELVDEGLVDYIAMDIKTDPFHYSPSIKKEIDPDSLLSSIQIIMNSALPYEFRTTCVKPIVDAEAVGNIVKTIKGSMLYALQRFNNSDVLHPEFFKEGNATYDDDELMTLKSIAEPWVKKCIAR